MGAATDSELDNLIDRGLSAVDNEAFEEAEQILDDARAMAGENHVRVLHLAGLLAWAQDDLEHATGFLMQASDMGSDRPEIYLDCAECLLTADEAEEAEAQTRVALKVANGQTEVASEARLLLAQIKLAVDDPDASLQELAQVPDELKEHPAFLSTHGAALMAAGQLPDAISQLEKATGKNEDDSDLHYQLAIALEAAGDTERSRQEMVKVLDLDVAEMTADGEPLPSAPDFAEQQDLRNRFEGILEELPDPILKLVASAPITVQARAERTQVEGGVNPRSGIAFLGTPKKDDSEAELKGIVLMRDALFGEVGDEDELDEELMYSVVEEIQYFFKRDDLVAEVVSG